ncbi:transposase [Nitrosomonas sp. Nm58]|uniref:transposase n=1 Tax=Nitrosomonas sp. Nm58 TaxID=200126 RepID=UPI00089539A0|nr:transposase [Nitrosomonas sp. Nm58]SDY98178.1 Transposase DDE domain group 1 [Nitrosomonas sp. Nm58]
MKYSGPKHIELSKAVAQVLEDNRRQASCKHDGLAHVYVGTLRLKLIKIGAVILRNTRRIRFLLASSCPYQKLFFQVSAKLTPG